MGKAELQRYTLFLRPEVVKLLRITAVEMGITVAELVTRLIQEMKGGENK